QPTISSRFRRNRRGGAKRDRVEVMGSSFLRIIRMGHQVTVQSSGHQFTVEAGQTVLDAALDAGVLLPYSCKSGSCSSCNGRVVSGEVNREHYQALSHTEEELAQGHRL